MRHIQPEYLNKKRVTFVLDNTWNLFQLVELSLHWLLLSRANVRFTQQNKVNYFSLTQFIEQTLKHVCCQPKDVSFCSKDVSFYQKDVCLHSNHTSFR